MDRQRITITIRQDLLAKIDKAIDGVQIRNRSHAIESLTTKALGSFIDHAVILAGGQGLELRPFTYELPKSMITIHDIPILEHLLSLLKDHHVTKVAILIGHLGEKIESYFGDGSKFGVKIQYHQEAKPLGTAGALRNVKKFVGNKPFFVINGDLLTRADLTGMSEFYQTNSCKNLMALTSVADPSVYGAVKLSGTQVRDFKEKPELHPSVSRLINAGIYIFSPSIFKLIPPKGKSLLENDVIPKIIETGDLSGFAFDEIWLDISTPESYERALKEWNNI